MTEPIIDSRFETLYEDADFLAVSKSGNCPVHEGGLFYENSLTKLLEKKLGYRVYPVYRLDKETSGIIVFAKSRDKVKKAEIMSKEYLGVCEGIIKERIEINEPLGEIKGDNVNWKIAVIPLGKKAVTIIEPIKSKNNMTLLRITPLTGRQHQIRAHLKHINHSIVGDKLYGDSDKNFKDYLEGKKLTLPINRQALHMHKIILNGKTIISPLPKEIEELLN